MVGEKRPENAQGKEPWGLRWRSSIGFVTFVVMLGLFTDLIVYTLIIPVIPYRLETLGYTGIGAKVSWLLVAFSGSMVLTTPLIAHFSEVYRNRKVPLVMGLVALAGSQVMFMEAPSYWLMVLARMLLGVSSSVIWAVGLALLCDTVPEQSLGRQFGIAFAGTTAGSFVGPPVAGTLYQRWGFRAPFIFGIIVTGIDLLARLLLIERHEAAKWGVDPTAATGSDENGPEIASGPTVLEKAELPLVPEPEPVSQVQNGGPLVSEGEGRIKVEIEEKTTEGDQTKSQLEGPRRSQVTLLPHTALLRLMKSPRAVACTIVTFIWALGWTAQEATVVLHLNKVWGLNSHQAGIAFIAAIVPTIFSGLLSGWLGDRFGAATVGCGTLLLTLPWCGLIAIEGSLAMFLTFFALEAFFSIGVAPVLTMELSSVCKTIDGVGYAHVYAAYNLAYGTGTTIGPIIAGQMYDHITRGWFAISFTVMGFMFVGFVLFLFMFGEQPLGLRLFRNKEQTYRRQTPQEGVITPA